MSDAPDDSRGKLATSEAGRAHDRAAALIPAPQATEWLMHHDRAELEGRSGMLTLRFRYHRGRIVKAAVIPDFEDEVR